MKGKYLITTDAWFYGPDGKKYRSAWGELNVMNDSILGIQTNRNSTNWFAQIGGNGKEIVIAGCQVHYACRCDDKPNTNDVHEMVYGENNAREIVRPNEIYIAE